MFLCYEKNSIPGGKAGLINEKGFRFDTGPSLLTMPFVLEKLFEECGEDISNYLTITPLKIYVNTFILMELN